MKSRLILAVFVILCSCLMPLTAAAQESATAAAVVAASDVLPNLVSYTGVLKDASGRTLTAVTGVTLLLYRTEHGGVPLWLETQNVTPDKTGRYTVQLGATTGKGLRSDLFVNGEARWLAVQIANEPEQPRVLLVAVPYAMRAVDAQTLGGLPRSAFVLAAPPSAAAAAGANPAGSTSVVPPRASHVTTSGGGVGTLALWDTTTDIKGSAVTQTGSGATAKIGINTGTPTATLDVAGGATVRGLLASTGSVIVDSNNTNAGTELPGIQFGTAACPGCIVSAISSARTSGSTNEVGLDFYTGSRRVMSIDPFSGVAIGSPPPLDSDTQLAVSANGSTRASNGFSAVAWSSAGDTFFNGGIGGSFTGGLGDHNNGFADGDGIDATNAGGGLASGGGFAGNFTGDINVSHQIFATVKDFKIDHPLDPANKYLFHSSVESSEMMNIYTGNVVLDARGEARIQLPDWFEALNRDFRYQLTAIGKPGPGLYIAEKISGNHFTIAGGSPRAEVSWQVTGVRQDAYAKAHPLVVEQPKPARERGYYIHPELFGAPEEKQIEWARNPAWMRQIKELKAKQKQAKPAAQLLANPSHASFKPVATQDSSRRIPDFRQ